MPRCVIANKYYVEAQTNWTRIISLCTSVGCPECSTKCNIDLKKKLLILFPTMAEKQISGVLAKEDGRPKINVNFAYGNNIIGR